MSLKDRATRIDLADLDASFVATDHEGRFSFERMPSRDPHVLIAIDGDIVCRPVRVVPDRLEVPIMLEGGRALVARVEFIDSMTGESIRVNPSFTGRGVGISERFSNVNGVKTTALPAPLPSLLGLPKNSDNPWHGWRLTALAPFSFVQEEVASLLVRAPGYEWHDASISFATISSSQETQRIDLTRSTQGWGSLSVKLKLSAQQLETGQSSPFKVVLSMQHATDSTPNTFEFPVNQIGQSLLIEEIPQGEYSVEIIAYEHLHRIKPIASEVDGLSIRNGVLHSVEFDLRPLQDAEFSLANSALVEFQGTFSGVLIRVDQSKMEPFQFHFDGPPYRFVGLPAGEYRLMTDPPVLYPPPVDPEAAGAPFQVGGDGPPMVHDLEVKF